MTDARKADQRKLRWLWASSALYFVLAPFGLRYAATLPYEIFVLAGVLNMIIMFIFIFSIKRVYLRTRTKANLSGSETSDLTPVSGPLDRRRLRWLWAGAIIYLLACINALSYLRQLPHQILLAVSLLNVGIAVGFVLEIKRTYRRLRH